MLTFDNPVNLRQIVTCAALSERPVLIENLHAYEQPQGVQAHEVRFLRLVELVSNGAKFEISKTGTTIKYYPGILTNQEGERIEFECGADRGIAYYLEYLCALALFAKAPLHILLRGVTNHAFDQSVDAFQSSALSVVRRFDADVQVSVKVHRRSFGTPDGEVEFKSSFSKFLHAVQLRKKGLVKRVRGVCAGARVAPSLLNNTISAARGVLNDFLPDVWVYSDMAGGKKKYGETPTAQGYAITLVAETNEGSFCAVDEIAEHKETAEQLGERAAKALLDEVLYCGAVDSTAQYLCLLLMSLSERKVSEVTLGRVSPFTVDCVRVIKQFFGVVFRIEPIVNEDADDDDDDDDDDDEDGNQDDDDDRMAEEDNDESGQKQKRDKTKGKK